MWGYGFDEPNRDTRSDGHTDKTKGVTMKTDGTKKKSAGKVPRTNYAGKAAAVAAEPAPQEEPVIEEFIPTVSDPFDVSDEHAPISMAPHPKRLAWSYSLLHEVDAQVMEDLVVEAGTKIGIEGMLERLGYLYVVQVGEDKSIEILFPPNGGSRRARPGTHIRLPSGTGWLTTTKKGKLRTITSSQPLSDAEIAALV